MTTMNADRRTRTTVECDLLLSIRAALMGQAPHESKIMEALALVEGRLLALEGEAPKVRHESMRCADRDEMPSWAMRASTNVTSAIETVRYSRGLVGDSPAMRLVHEAIERVSGSHATVLLRGESGTGKELIAQTIHLLGPRAQQSFVPLHCAAVSDTLLESELFGHERGAFTGAVESRKGRFELADDGTLFLDEIGDIPPSTQVKLLRVLQEKCFERVGGSRSVSVDVRVISATHRDLEAMVRAGAFREDLYYRLNVVPITLPPLRERTGDIPLLIDHFMAARSRERRRRVRLSHDLMDLMARYHWPGNIRELQNCIERLVVMADPENETITFNTIPPSLRGYFADMRAVTEVAASETGSSRAERVGGGALGASLREIERDRLMDALRRTGGVQARAARVLGLTPRQVGYKIRKYGISQREEN